MAEVEEPAKSLEEITRALRGSLASLRAAAETLELFPQMAEEQQRRLRAVVSGETRRLSRLVDRLEKLNEPENEPTRKKTTAAELAAEIAARAFAQLGFEVEREDGEPARLEVDTEALVPAAVGLLETLRRDFAIGRILLRQKAIEHHAVFDLVWQADPASLEALRDWQSEALESKAAGGAGLRPTVRSHGGEAWFNLDRQGGEAYLRFLLPLAP